MRRPPGAGGGWAETMPSSHRFSRAVDTPVIGLYGYTNPKRTGPYRRYQDLVVDGYAAFAGEAYPVTPQYRDGMKRVTVEGVLQKLDLALERYVEL